MKPFSFRVDGKVFTARPGFAEKTLPIASVPFPYEVSFPGAGAGPKALSRLLVENPASVLLIDEKVLALYGRAIKAPPERVFALPATERFKTLSGVKKVLDFMKRRSLGKGARAVVVGGGITQDICGFTCAVYKRGVDWTFFPTTLLSMCDSCIGAKTGVNYGGAKNQLGLFSSPRGVVIDPAFLKTLEAQQIKSGLGEIIKLAILGGESPLEFAGAGLEAALKGDTAVLEKLIRVSLAIKKSVIEADEFERGSRRALNYGHTAGHAIEAFTRYRIPHGEGVAMGIIVADALSAAHGLMREAERLRNEIFCRRIIGHKLSPRVPEALLAALVKNDKKTSGGFISFVMLRTPGDCVFVKTEAGPALAAEMKGIIRKYLC